MSRNLSSLSFRQGTSQNLFERMVQAAETDGSAEHPEVVRKLGEASLFGDAITLGAVSFYDFLKKENAGKKVFLCNGSACLCAGTQEKLHETLGTHFKPEEIGHICCLGRCVGRDGAASFGGCREQLFAAAARVRERRRDPEPTKPTKLRQRFSQDGAGGRCYASSLHARKRRAQHGADRRHLRRRKTWQTLVTKLRCSSILVLIFWLF